MFHPSCENDLLVTVGGIQIIFFSKNGRSNSKTFIEILVVKEFVGS